MPAQEDAPVYTATVIYSYIWNINDVRHEASTYTHTYSNTPGIHTAWPVVVHPGMRADQQREVLAIPLTLTSPGGLWTLSTPATRATHSPTRAAPRIAGNMPPTPRVATAVAVETERSIVSLLGISEDGVNGPGIRYAAFGLLLVVCLTVMVCWRRRQPPSSQKGAHGLSMSLDDSKSARMQA